MSGPKKRLGPATKGTVGNADFYNAKNSKYSEGYRKTTGASSAEPDSYYKDNLPGAKPYPNIMTSDNENSRQSRLGKKQTVSGPKSRKADAKFFPVTTKGK